MGKRQVKRWPVHVTCDVHVDGQRVRISRIVEGAGDAHGAMRAAVSKHPRAALLHGAVIRGLTPLGQHLRLIY